MKYYENLIYKHFSDDSSNSTKSVITEIFKRGMSKNGIWKMTKIKKLYARGNECKYGEEFLHVYY